jgi:hypothetical protein
MDHGLFWVPLTLVAAALQVVRNGAQANLTGKIGTASHPACRSCP